MLISNGRPELSKTVRVSGFAKALVRWLDFESASAEDLYRVLVGVAETPPMDYLEPSAHSPSIQSNAPFTDLVFFRHGKALPWHFLHSELAAPFLSGVNQCLMDSEGWVPSYSAITEAVVVRIPKSVMAPELEELPSVGERMHELVLRRIPVASPPGTAAKARLARRYT